MNMKHLRILFALALLIPTFLIHAQEDESANEEDNTLRGQFEELERKSGNYRANGIRYEVIKLSDLYETKNNIFDSLDTANKNIKDLTSTDNLLAPPVYTRPADYKGFKVPEILLSGNFPKIEKWREQQALERTQERRPDLLEE